MVEPALAADNAEETVQFERQGYFRRDPDSAPGRLVFNRTIGLRDSWAKAQSGGCADDIRASIGSGDYRRNSSTAAAAPRKVPSTFA